MQHTTLPCTARVEVRQGRPMFTKTTHGSRSPEIGEEFNMVVSGSWVVMVVRKGHTIGFSHTLNTGKELNTVLRCRYQRVVRTGHSFTLQLHCTWFIHDHIPSLHTHIQVDDYVNQSLKITVYRDDLGWDDTKIGVSESVCE
jgi:hypothetical protein